MGVKYWLAQIAGCHRELKRLNKRRESLTVLADELMDTCQTEAALVERIEKLQGLLEYDRENERLMGEKP